MVQLHSEDNRGPVEHDKPLLPASLVYKNHRLVKMRSPEVEYDGSGWLVGKQEILSRTSAEGMWIDKRPHSQVLAP